MQPIVIQVPSDREGLGDKAMKNYQQGDKLDEYDIKYLTCFDRVYYWYEYGGYDGGGTLIGISEGRRHIVDLSHCSCYGPCENINLKYPYESLEKCLEGAKFSDKQKLFIKKDYL